jgi:tRNA(fMet)-specific endonuclease VapC
MVILDTNHFSELERNGSAGQRLTARIHEKEAAVFITVVTSEEVLAGWLAKVRRQQSAAAQVEAYDDFIRGLESLHRANTLPWSMDASNIFDELRRRGVRIGTLDLRIASIALNYDALVLTRNLVDFQRVPGLRVDNWLD